MQPPLPGFHLSSGDLVDLKLHSLAHIHDFQRVHPERVTHRYLNHSKTFTVLKQVHTVENVPHILQLCLLKFDMNGAFYLINLKMEALYLHKKEFFHFQWSFL